MELRHLRYFLAVAEHGSLTVAAERLHTVQPSLSRQIQDLEEELGVALFTRKARGVELTAAGRVFQDQVRLALGQVDNAVALARRAALPERPIFSMGFLTGQEIDWLPHATGVLGAELPRIEVRVVSNYSPVLADELVRGRLDVAVMRREKRPELAYEVVAEEPLVAVMPSDLALTAKKAIAPRDLVDVSFLGMSETAPVLREAIRAYLRRSGVKLKVAHEVDNLAMAMSMVASTRGVALLPQYAENFMPWAVTSRPLVGDPPTIELVVGYRRGDDSPLVAMFLERVPEIATRFRAARTRHKRR